MKAVRKPVSKAKSPKGSQKWKCATTPPAKRRERMYVRGLDADGRVVFEKSFACKRWFEDLHPVVMQNALRRELGVVRILMRRYNKYGSLIHDILHDYSPETGEYVYGECRHPNNSLTKY